jgi:glycosyltransferase 2 family protein
MKKVLLTLLLIFVVIGLAGLYGDFREVGSSIWAFDWYLLPMALLMAFISYAARGIRWHVLLNIASDREIDKTRNGMIYTASLVGIVTPAKAGEVTRAYYAKEAFDVPLSRSTPVLLSERLMDGIAMIVFAGLGLFLYETRLIVLWFVILGGLTVLILSMRNRTVLSKVIALLQKLPGTTDDEDSGEEFVETSQKVFEPRSLFPSLAFGLVVWGGQALVYFFVILGLGETLDFNTFVRSLFIYPMSMLIGTITLLPLGIGPTDASLVLLGQGILELESGAVVAAAFITRAVIILPALAAGIIASLSPQVRPLLA